MSIFIKNQVNSMVLKTRSDFIVSKTLFLPWKIAFMEFQYIEKINTYRPYMSIFIKNQVYLMVFKTRSRGFIVSETLFSSWKIVIIEFQHIEFRENVKHFWGPKCRYWSKIKFTQWCCRLPTLVPQFTIILKEKILKLTKLTENKVN